MTDHHPPTTSVGPPPTAHQHRYLRQLALHRGVSFVVPKTRAEASRVIRGQRVLGVVRLVDAPACGEGRHYVIERELTVMAELDAIVADYLEQARIWNVIPAAGSCPLVAEREEARR